MRLVGFLVCNNGYMVIFKKCVCLVAKNEIFTWTRSMFLIGYTHNITIIKNNGRGECLAIIFDDLAWVE